MKKAILCAAAVLAFCMVVEATNQVSSVNVAGYLKSTLNRGKFSMLRFDFFTMQGNATVSNVIGRQLPVGTRIYLWTGSGYRTEEFKLLLGPPPLTPILGTNWNPGTNILDPGNAFWVSIPGSAPQPTYTLNLLGEVPNNPTSTVPIRSSFNMVGYSYPTDVAWKDTKLAQTAKVGDKVFFWNGSGYDGSEFKLILGPPPLTPILGTNWTGIGTSYVVRVGNGFWYQSTRTTNSNWRELRPYNLD